MNLKKNIGGILRVRPGHLANFSGAAGYMPFIVITSVPASLLFGIVTSLILTIRGRSISGEEGWHKTGLYTFVQFVRWHTSICILIGIAAGIFLLSGAMKMSNSHALKYILMAVVLAAGPLAAWLLSMFALIWLIMRRGPLWTNLIFAALAHILLLAACIPLLKIIEKMSE